jgi:hypothetical protein
MKIPAPLPFGGEAARKQDLISTVFTDSGRSSLKLVLSQLKRPQKVLLPDFICGVIPETLQGLGFGVEYYHIREDLTVDPQDLTRRRGDILYLIDYFGMGGNDGLRASRTHWLVIFDHVFVPMVEPPDTECDWACFNSYRKATHLADGSCLRATIDMGAQLLKPPPAPFAVQKYSAKAEKFAVLEGLGSADETTYLRAFDKGEALLEQQMGVYCMSHQSHYELTLLLSRFSAEKKARIRNYDTLDRYLASIRIGGRPRWPTFYPILVDDAKGFKKAAEAKRIFLPSFWPNVTGRRNRLYNCLVCIPVDSRYSEAEMVRVGEIAARLTGKAA